MRTPIILAAIAGSLTASAATAQVADQDMKCLLAANAFSSQEKDPQKKQLAMAAGMFFSGRVDARLSPAQIKAQILTLNKTLKPADLGPLMDGCARQFIAKQQALQTIGKSIAASLPAPGPAAPTGPKPTGR